MEFKQIEVNGQKYTALLLPDAKEVADQHQTFLNIFERSTSEVQALWANSTAFGDPTIGLSEEVLADTYDNAVLIPESIMAELDIDPLADVNAKSVFLVKPSGVYSTTYLESMRNQFPRIMTDGLQNGLDPTVYIKAFKNG